MAAFCEDYLMKLSLKRFGWGHVGLGLMGLTILACGGGSSDGGTDRILTRNYFAVNAGYDSNPQKFFVAGSPVPATGSSASYGYSLDYGVISRAAVKYVNKQLDPILFEVKKAATDATLISSSQQVTSSDRHFLVTYGPETATKGLIIPLEPVTGTKVVFDAAMLDSSETRVVDLYLLEAGQTLAAATPVFSGLKYDPLTPNFMVQQNIRPMGGTYTLKLTTNGTKTEIPEYTQSVTLTDKFFHLLIFSKKNGVRNNFIVKQLRAAS
jgi:hypothetical protein